LEKAEKKLEEFKGRYGKRFVELEDGLWGKKYENEEEKKEWKEDKNELAAEKGRLEAEVTKCGGLTCSKCR